MEPAFNERMRALFCAANGEWGCAEDYFAALSASPVRGLRVNGLRTAPQQLAALLPYELHPTPFATDGFVLGQVPAGVVPPGLHPLHAAGLYYMQEPSAMICASMLLPHLHLSSRVLDLCAAPGGKTAQLLSAMQGKGILFANEYVPTRARVLLSNVERMGARNCVVTCCRPDALAAASPAWFDAVVADVPCSGEGMLRKEPEAARNWSEKNVAACVVRGREILISAVQLLRTGGLLAYSTCTLNRDENENQLAWLTENLGMRVVQVHESLRDACDRGLPPFREALRVFPHRAAGEGHFACLLEKTDAAPKIDSRSPARMPTSRTRPVRKTDKSDEFLRLWHSLTDEPVWGSVRYSADGVYLVPEDMPDWQEGVLRAGVRAADVTPAGLVPHHQLAMTLHPAFLHTPCKLDSLEAAGAYLAGEELAVGGSGWQVATMQGFALGLVKASGGRGKNHYPKGLRYRLPRNQTL